MHSDPTMREYAEAAARTLPDNLDDANQLTMLGLGLAGEAGEAIEMVKKHLFHGHELDRAKLAEELGDVLWYLAGLASHCGGLDAVAKANIAKLKKRYAAGFSQDASRMREVP